MKQNKSMKWALSLVGATALLAGCGAAGSTTENTESDKLQVVTTFYPMYDFTKQVAQDDAEVSMLLEAGMEVHSFEPSSQMIAEIQDADVFIYNSPEMETWVPDVLASIDTSDMVVICASDAITLLEYEGEAHAHDHESEEKGANAGHSHTVDPHVWLDPVLAQTEVSTIAEGLAEADPDNAEDYLENAGIYNGKLNELDEAYRAAFEGTENRTFVTQHAAFAYLAARYDLNQISVTGLNAEVEPSAAAVKVNILFLPPSSPIYFVPFLIIEIFTPECTFFLSIVQFGLQQKNGKPDLIHAFHSLINQVMFGLL